MRERRARVRVRVEAISECEEGVAHSSRSICAERVTHLLRARLSLTGLLLLHRLDALGDEAFLVHEQPVEIVLWPRVSDEHLGGRDSILAERVLSALRSTVFVHERDGLPHELLGTDELGCASLAWNAGLLVRPDCQTNREIEGGASHERAGIRGEEAVHVWLSRGFDRTLTGSEVRLLDLDLLTLRQVDAILQLIRQLRLELV